MKRPFPNCYWVLPGSLLAGEYPYSEEPLPERATLGLLLQAGIDAFVDLTEPGERPDYRSLLPAHAHYLRRPIVDMGVPRLVDEMRVIQMHLRALLASGRRVYVHCRAGIGRTGTVIGCYLVEQGLDGQGLDAPEALRQLNRLWKQSARSAFFARIPQTPEQADYIRLWAQRSRPEPGAPLAGQADSGATIR